jgi:sulfatase maturation enzyme AslB (radical SAM superfamily)
VSNLYTFETIRKLEIDCTSFCNAFCGACDRNIDGGKNHPNLILSHLRREAWEALFTAENLEHINEVIFNGNFGDFSMHPQIIPMLEHLLSVKSNLYINMHTNGTARNLQFWKDLAAVLQKFAKHDVKFGIDGDKVTHDYYRRGLKWYKRIGNLKAFNESGGNSIWKTIVFDHNKEDLEFLEEYARAYKCMSFQTNRNRSGDMILTGHQNKASAIDLPFMIITSPSPEEFKAKYQRRVDFRQQVRTPSTTAQEANGTYNCPYGKEGMIQIDPWGNVWPCCYISGRQLDRNTNFPYGDFDTNIERFTLRETLNTLRPFLEKEWAASSLDICNRCAGITIPAPKY